MSCRQAIAPYVTDRALVRFLSRSGVDVEGVRAAIGNGLAVAHGAAVAMGGGDHLVVVEGLTFVVRGGNVTTVLHDAGVRDRMTALAAQD